MKLTPLKIGFVVSIVCHGLAFGLVMAVGSFRHPPKLPQPEAPMTLTLIAAPEEPVAPMEPPAVVSKPPKDLSLPEPKPQIPAITQSVPKDEVPDGSVVPSAPPATNAPPVSEPKIVASANANSTPAVPVQGDSSSPVPGKDATTVPGTPEVKAKPDYLKNPQPAYPLIARRRRQEGTVLLAVKVNEAGKVDGLKIEKSSGFPLLDEAALQTVREWEFQPARVGLRSVASEVDVPIRFQIEP